MLKKELMAPQSLIRTIDDFVMYTDDVLLSAGPVDIVPAGIDLTVIHGPKRKSGINFAKVETAQGMTGYVFWCHLKDSCNHI